MTLIESTPIPESSRTAKAHSDAKNTDTVVELYELGEGHRSKMAYELRIVHPDRSPEETGSAITGNCKQAAEVHRFLDEKSARDSYDAYVRALTPPDEE